jgi:hypothetical protein
MTKFRRVGLWTALALFCVFIAGAIVIRSAFGWYLGSEGFHRRISRATARALQADGEFLPLHFGGMTVYSDGFAARGKGSAFFSTLRADQIRADFNWRGLLHRAWQIDELTAQRLDIRFADRQPEKPELVRQKRQSRAAPSGWRLDLRRASIQESRWHWGEGTATGGSITGSALDLTPSGSSWIIAASGGKLEQTGWPELNIESAKLRYTSGALFVTESALRSGAGRVLVTGEVELDRAADLQAEFENLAVAPLLPADWRLRLSGNFSGTAKIHAPISDPKAMQVSGSLRLSDGQLEALPMLDQIATFTGSERFRRMALSKASVEFTRDAHSVSVKNLVLESEGLLRMEGAFSVQEDRIDGNFQVGVTASSLQWLPGSRERVFTVAHDGYFWTPMHLSGPVAHPSEDLTPRLVAAAAGQLFNDPEKAARDAAKSILDLLPH